MILSVELGRLIVAAFKPISAFLSPVIKNFGTTARKVFEFISEAVKGMIPVVKSLEPPFTVIGVVLGVILKGLGGLIDFLKPLAPLIGGIVAVIGIWTAAQWLLNIAMTANPIGLIIAAVIAGVALIIGLVMVIIENWNKIVEGIKTACNSIIDFFKKWGMTILKVLGIIIFGIPMLIALAVRQIIKHWDVIGPKVKAVWEKLAEVIKAIWLSVTDWFAGLVERIKTIWTGIIGFFSGLWEAIKQGPSEALEYIKNAFFGLFNSIQEKLFGFINKIKEGWETVKGFFGGIADGVVNFFTGGGNDGTGGGQMQPAYADSASQAAMAGAVGQTSNYAYTTRGGSSTVNAQTSINVSVPPGTPQEQREAIARQVGAQFDAKLTDSINSSRSNIPSPEVRRH
jgi:phage-related protein